MKHPLAIVALVPKEAAVFAARAVVGAAAKRFRELRSPTGKALQRAAFYFKEAIQCLLTGFPSFFNRGWSSLALLNEIPKVDFSIHNHRQVNLRIVLSDGKVYFSFDVSGGSITTRFLLQGTIIDPMKHTTSLRRKPKEADSRWGLQQVKRQPNINQVEGSINRR
ncbi:unnamed protein product [Lactuca virosa]|uniref:Uncharacterized protein n=1 Tax=Lactuca virosa TaxID=75947 RepID=A0AAU9LIG2_9ASTR|nr:unnamed protein product [Lactuca virosa]